MDLPGFLPFIRDDGKSNDILSLRRLDDDFSEVVELPPRSFDGLRLL